MDREALVYVDLDGTPQLVGRLWARVRKNKEGRHFRIRQNMAGQSGAVLARTCPAAWSWSLSHAGRHIDVRRDR